MAFFHRGTQRANTEIRMALIGRTGSGKSATGNTILSRDAFTEQFSPQAVTQTCERQTALVGGLNISVTDTPGLLNTALTEMQLMSEMEKCALLSFPGLHVFLLVVRLDVRLTDEEKNIVTWIKSNFGENAARYTMILFTHDDQLDGRHLDDFIRNSADLQSLINSCDGRYHSLSNRNRANQDQVTMLLMKIKQMMQINITHHSTAEEFSRAQELKQTKQEIEACIAGACVVLLGVTLMRFVSCNGG